MSINVSWLRRCALTGTKNWWMGFPCCTGTKNWWMGFPCCTGTKNWWMGFPCCTGTKNWWMGFPCCGTMGAGVFLLSVLFIEFRCWFAEKMTGSRQRKSRYFQGYVPSPLRNRSWQCTSECQSVRPNSTTIQQRFNNGGGGGGVSGKDDMIWWPPSLSSWSWWSLRCGRCTVPYHFAGLFSDGVLAVIDEFASEVTLEGLRRQSLPRFFRINVFIQGHHVVFCEQQQ